MADEPEAVGDVFPSARLLTFMLRLLVPSRLVTPPVALPLLVTDGSLQRCACLGFVSEGLPSRRQPQLLVMASICGAVAILPACACARCFFVRVHEKAFRARGKSPRWAPRAVFCRLMFDIVRFPSARQDIQPRSAGIFRRGETCRF